MHDCSILVLEAPSHPRQGVILRDSKGIGQSKSLTGTKVLRVLKAKGAYLMDASSCM